MAIVLDASVAVAWAFEDENSAYTNRVLDMLVTSSAQVPSIWPLEVANALLSAERRQRIGTAETARFIALLSGLPVDVVGIAREHTMGVVLDLARTHGLTVYDACYLFLAMREGLPLATQDGRLRSAASRVAVPCVE